MCVCVFQTCGFLLVILLLAQKSYCKCKFIISQNWTSILFVHLLFFYYQLKSCTVNVVFSHMCFFYFTGLEIIIPINVCFFQICGFLLVILLLAQKLYRKCNFIISQNWTSIFFVHLLFFLFQFGNQTEQAVTGPNVTSNR